MTLKIIRNFLIATTTFWWSGSLGSGADNRPNIIFILADDYGIPGLSCYGGAYATPHLDALAKEGIRFERCFSAPLCAPSRALAMSGRYSFRTGVTGNSSGAMLHPSNEVSIARTLKQAGYATAVAGKWRQLSHFTTREDGQAWGFDEFLIWGVSSDKGERYWEPAYNHNGTYLKDVAGKYGPDLLHEFVADFVRRHRDKPFFIYYPTPLIHGPILRTPDTRAGVAEQARLYADNITYLDKLMGKLITELDTLQLREKTLIVFTGDNGSVGEHKINGRVIQGKKGQLNEGGSRVALIANWKGTTPAGKVLPDLVDFTDFYVTFTELAGARLPEGVKLDGRSFAPQLRGQRGNPRDWVFIMLGDKWYVRSDAWKLTKEGHLFSMKEAPFAEQLVNAASTDAESVQARGQLQAVLDQLQPSGGRLRAADTNPEAKKKKKNRKRVPQP